MAQNDAQDGRPRTQRGCGGGEGMPELCQEMADRMSGSDSFFQRVMARCMKRMMKHCLEVMKPETPGAEPSEVPRD